MANPKLIRARVLTALTLSGVSLRPNDIVSVDDKTLRAHEAALDGAAEAVEAALAAGGKEVSLQGEAPT